MSEVRDKAQLIVAGRGGHAAEMAALLYGIDELMSPATRVVISDEPSPLSFTSAETFYVGEMRKKAKNHKKLVTAVVHLYRCFKVLSIITRRYDVTHMISTGPGIALMPALLMWIRRKPIVYVECSARFYSLSPTGRCLRFLATKFYVQHESMLSIAPFATYSGLLLK